jgi:hypothetical protein
MAQPRYNARLQAFIREWRPNSPELDGKFMDSVRGLVSAIVSPAVAAFEVETILSNDGGKVVVRLGDYEAQLAPVEAQRFALALVEAATSARTESWLVRFLNDELEVTGGAAARIIASFRDYRIGEMQRELAADMERGEPAAAPAGGKP